MTTPTSTDDRFQDRLLALLLEEQAALPPAAPVRIHPYRRRVGVPAVAVGAAAAAALVVLSTASQPAPHRAALPTSAAPGSSAGAPATAATTTVAAQTTTTVAPRASDILYQLASASEVASSPTGRYVILSEHDLETNQPSSDRTTVVDTLTGASTTYQSGLSSDGGTIPPVQTTPADPTSTAQWYNSLPTDPVRLRPQLLAIAKAQEPPVSSGTGLPRQTRLQYLQQLEKSEPKFAQEYAALIAADPGSATQLIGGGWDPTDDDLVYQEADTLLWSPLCGPQLRSALYQVLAQTPGVAVSTNATDPDGRPAIAMTRSYTGFRETDITFEDPINGAVLAQVWNSDGDVITATYQPVTGSDIIPPSPYSG